MKKVLVSLFVLYFSTTAYAKHIHLEKWYQEQWCSSVNGTEEYKLPDAARVDCLTDGYAIEFDFAAKWAEAIGQALYYGKTTGRDPGIVLILEHPQSDVKYVKRLRGAIEGLGIRVWLIGPEGEALAPIDQW